MEPNYEIIKETDEKGRVVRATVKMLDDYPAETMIEQEEQSKPKKAKNHK